ncbi:hypothetical protein BpHYR1_000544 [Brachionus plicatilis]|uniref:Uncharacterized protein n=1 Tax=Brachionus plicatilis TaxID=10195 RepID=A0A3M7R9F5_BRAPC|nr:hypothetical protein BpHYR1_000544 [Brachionus plicatilis]
MKFYENLQNRIKLANKVYILSVNIVPKMTMSKLKIVSGYQKIKAKVFEMQIKNQFLSQLNLKKYQNLLKLDIQRFLN